VRRATENHTIQKTVGANAKFVRGLDTKQKSAETNQTTKAKGIANTATEVKKKKNKKKKTGKTAVEKNS